MKHVWQRLLVLGLLVAGLGLGACTNAREGGSADSSSTAGSSSSSDSTTGGTSLPTM